MGNWMAVLTVVSSASAVKREGNDGAASPRHEQQQASGTAMPRRRSARLIGKPAVAYVGVRTMQSPESLRAGSTTAVRTRVAKRSGDRKPKLRNAPHPRSSRVLTCDVDGLVRSVLGKEVPPRHGAAMKAAAMAISCKEGVMPRFSRMSGIQQWQNAVALFVNVGGVDYQNLFFRNGQHITWYAQRTQHAQSPVIVRLRHGAPKASVAEGGSGGRGGDDDVSTVGDDAATEAATEGQVHVKVEGGVPCCQVVLWCRLPGRPYVFCGRLHLVDADVGARPRMQFVWALADYHALRNSEMFVNIVNAGGPVGDV